MVARLAEPRRGRAANWEDSVKIQIFGCTGQVATELARCCPTDIQATFLGRDQADLSDPATCAAIIEATNADVVINAAAYTSVDKAEEEETLATVVNGDAPAAMAEAAAKRNLPFLHISSDYVFDGSGERPFAPDHPTAPLGVYGRSKLKGEAAVLEAGGPYAILRTSWVFSAHGKNFVKTMLRLGEERPKLGIVADQIGGPTPAADIAKTLFVMAKAFHRGQAKSGIWHFSGAPDTSWADFAREIFKQAELATVVEEISTANYPTPATRPLNSRLDCSTLETIFGTPRPDWRVGLADVIKDLRK